MKKHITHGQWKKRFSKYLQKAGLGLVGYDDTFIQNICGRANQFYSTTPLSKKQCLHRAIVFEACRYYRANS